MPLSQIAECCPLKELKAERVRGIEKAIEHYWYSDYYVWKQSIEYCISYLFSQA